ncbi:prepilin peptidase [Pantoea stewartii]|uniref:prepilin peptidase n=1 Tax=Pantoea stewartii TaxID=66269 RepID=UPI001561D3BB|nr:TapD [Pantoea stewartii]
MLLIIVAVSLSGGALGSFLALACQRFHTSASPRRWLQSLWTPPSHCSYCRRTILWHDSVPLISWLLLRGHCRFCSHPVGLLPVLFELTGALLCLLLAYLFYDNLIHALFPLLASCLLLVLAAIDQRHFLLPDVLTHALLWLGLSRFMFFQPLTVSSAIGGVMFGYGSLWLLAGIFQQVTRRKGLGCGDIKLFAALGAWCGWQALPFIALTACTTALIAFGALRIRNRAWYLNSPLPFGPFLAVAGWGVIISQSLTLL